MTTNTAIQLKKSGVTGNTPSDLQLGEVAINYADGKLYYKDDINAIRYITNQETFGTISANGTLILATNPTDILTITTNNNIKIVGDSGSKSINFDLSDNINVKNNVISQNVVALNQFYAGIATYSSTPLPNLIAQFTGNTNSYVQVNAQNIDEHGTSDYVLTADVGHDNEFYLDVGIINSQYDNLNPNNSLGTAAHPLDGYLYVQGSAIDQIGGNLIIGVTHTGQDIKFIAGGVNAENVITKISETNVHVYKDLIVDGSITGPTITNLQNFTQAAFDKANTGGGGPGGTSNAFSVISVPGYTNIIANNTSNTLTFIAQTGIAIGTDPSNSQISIATNLIGASNVVVDYGTVTDILGSITFDYGYVS